MKCIQKLKVSGFQVFLEGDSIKYRYTGNGRPNPSIVTPLLRELKEKKEEAIRYLKEEECLPLKCSRCGKSHDEVGILLDVAYFDKEVTVCKECYKRLN